MIEDTKIGQVGRWFRIILMLTSRRDGDRLTAKQLADIMGCSDRTVKRDIEHLRSTEIPIDYDEAKHSYVLVKGWTFPIAPLTPAEVLALGLVEAWIAKGNGAFPYSDQISSALRKSTSCLTPTLMKSFSSVGEYLVEVGGTARQYSEAPIGLLLQAIIESRTIEIRYESRTSPEKIERRRIDPHRFDRRDGQYYELQGYCHEHREMRTFAVDRMRELEITDNVFRRREDSPDDHGVFGGLRSNERVAVEVRFNERVANAARDRRWNARETFEDYSDGSVIMRCESQGTDGLVKELLRWGRNVEVIGGPELREAVKQEVTAMRMIYIEK